MLEYVLKGLLVLSSIAVHSLQGVFTALSKNNSSNYSFSIFMSSLLTEMLKLIVSFSIFQFQLWMGYAERHYYSVKEILLWAIPASLYMVANNLFFIVIQISDSPITQQVFGSLEIVVIGLANVFILHRKLSRYQWCALVLLTCSVASIQLAKSGPSNTSELAIPLLPALLTVVSSSLAGCAGVVIEKLMKGKRQVSLFQQNTWLYFWGSTLNFALLVMENGTAFPQQMTLTTFNQFGLLTIANTVCMGLITVGILKYLSAVVKSFTSSASLVLTSLLSSFLFNVDLKYPSLF